MVSVRFNSEIKVMKEIGKVIDYILNSKIPEFLIYNIPHPVLIEELISDIFTQEGITSIKGFVIDGYLIDCNVHISTKNCLSHGDPSKQDKLLNGDLCRVDLVGFKNGLYCDAARTFLVGDKEDEIDYKLLKAGKEALLKVMSDVKIGDKISKIGKIVEKVASKYGFVVPADLGGHGIGPILHDYPHVSNVFNINNNDIIKHNTVLCVEPMFLDFKSNIFSDEFYAIMTEHNNTKSVHFENTLHWSDMYSGSCVSLTGDLK